MKRFVFYLLVFMLMGSGLAFAQPVEASLNTLSLTTLNNSVILPVGQNATLRFNTTGIASSNAVVSVEGTVDGTTWTAPLTYYAAVSQTPTTSQTNTDASSVYMPIAGYSSIRYIVTTAGLGSASIYSRFSTAPSVGLTAVTTGSKIAPPAAAASACAASTVVTGGTAVTAITANTIVNGARIGNPATATEPIFVNTLTTATTTVGGTNEDIAPGKVFTQPGSAAVAISVDAVTNGHVFTCAKY